MRTLLSIAPVLFGLLIFVFVVLPLIQALIDGLL